jgi:hypothetical protein
MRRQEPPRDLADRFEETFMKGKLSLAAVAVVFATMALPGTASAGFDRYDCWRRDCMFGWMHRGWGCDRKVVVVKHKKHRVHKKVLVK